MDQIKIGKYIAEKRKHLGLTQIQLAEKLGMSDKSVSKWERGICLPDISVYMQLCDILSISLNEFIAGEDLDEKSIVKKSEENLLQVFFDGKFKGKRLKKIIGILLSIIIFVTGALIYVVCLNEIPRQNYIMPVAKESVQMKTAELLSGIDGAFLYEYSVDGGYSGMRVDLSVYENGRLTNKENVLTISMDNQDGGEGILAIVPDFDNLTVRIVLADNEGKYKTDLNILEGVKDGIYYGRSASEITEKMNIHENMEQGFLALIYDKDYMSAVPIETIAEGNESELQEDDFIYYFSVNFTNN